MGCKHDDTCDQTLTKGEFESWVNVALASQTAILLGVMVLMVRSNK